MLKIKPEVYVAARKQSEAAYKSSVAAHATAEATVHRAEAEYKRHQDLLRDHLVSDSVFDEVKANCEVARAQVASSDHQVEMAKASLDSADESLAKTTLHLPSMA